MWEGLSFRKTHEHNMAFRNPQAEKIDYMFLYKDIHPLPILLNKYLLWTFQIEMYL